MADRDDHVGEDRAVILRPAGTFAVRHHSDHGHIALLQCLSDPDPPLPSLLPAVYAGVGAGMRIGARAASDRCSLPVGHARNAGASGGTMRPASRVCRVRRYPRGSGFPFSAFAADHPRHHADDLGRGSGAGGLGHPIARLTAARIGRARLLSLVSLALAALVVRAYPDAGRSVADAPLRPGARLIGTVLRDDVPC